MFMKRTIIIKKIDYLFLFAAIFFIVFVFLNYFVNKLIVCFTLSFVASYLVYYILAKIISYHNIRISTKKTDLNNIAKLKQYFAVSGTETSKTYLNTLLNATITDYGLSSKDADYYIDFSKQELNLYDFTSIIQALCNQSKTKYIIAEKLSSDLADFLETLNTPIKHISIEELYFNHIKDWAPLPTLNIKQKNPNKNTFKQLFRLALSKDKSKKYFFNGILIMVFSFIYPFHNYYFVFSLILFTLAVVSFFEPFKTTYN